MIVRTAFGIGLKEILFEKCNENNEIVGRAYLIIHQRPDDLGKVGLVEDVWTHEEHRRKGIASELMNELIKIAKERGCYKLVLQCSDKNIHLYETVGFFKNENAMRLNLNG